MNGISPNGSTVISMGSSFTPRAILLRVPPKRNPEILFRDSLFCLRCWKTKVLVDIFWRYS